MTTPPAIHSQSNSKIDQSCFKVVLKYDDQKEEHEIENGIEALNTYLYQFSKTIYWTKAYRIRLYKPNGEIEIQFLQKQLRKDFTVKKKKTKKD